LAEIKCPECGATESKPGKPFDPMSLGLHRKRAHGVAGKTSSKRVAKPRKDKAPRGPGSPAREPSVRSQVKTGVLGFAKTGSVALRVMGDEHCATVLQSDRMGVFATALADLAASDPKYARWLGWTGKAGPLATVFFAGADVAFPMLAHHGIFPPSMMLEGAVADSNGSEGRVVGSLERTVMEARGARHDLGADRLGEDDASSRSAPEA
jgi:hypothetical protein